MRQKAIKVLKLIKDVLADESKETNAMLTTYAKFVQGDATKADMAKANEKFRQLLKGLGVGALVILPLAPVTLPFAFKISKRLGIDLLPPSLRRRYPDL